MTETPTDWQEIAGLLSHLHSTRAEIRSLSHDEFELIENAVHYANKKLDGFAFNTQRHKLKSDDALASVRIDLVDLEEREPLPWSYQATYYYAGHFDAFFARPTGEDGRLHSVERNQVKIGLHKGPHWEWVLQVIAQLNLRDTPRKAELV